MDLRDYAFRKVSGQRRRCRLSACPAALEPRFEEVPAPYRAILKIKYVKKLELKTALDVLYFL